MTHRHPIETRLRDLIQRFEGWAGGRIDVYIEKAGTGMTPYDEEALTGDINQALDAFDGVQSFRNIQAIAEESLDYQGADIAADWWAIRTPVEDMRNRLAAGGATRWDGYTHTVVGGRGVISIGSRTDATLSSDLSATKTAIEAFLANIP